MVVSDEVPPCRRRPSQSRQEGVGTAQGRQNSSSAQREGSAQKVRSVRRSATTREGYSGRRSTPVVWCRRRPPRSNSVRPPRRLRQQAWQQRRRAAFPRCDRMTPQPPAVFPPSGDGTTRAPRHALLPPPPHRSILPVRFYFTPSVQRSAVARARR
jgi:hypothetical protein